jgi:hypothetical protein
LIEFLRLASIAREEKVTIVINFVSGTPYTDNGHSRPPFIPASLSVKICKVGAKQAASCRPRPGVECVKCIGLITAANTKHQKELVHVP